MLKTVDELVGALGGPKGIQELFGIKLAPNAVAMWVQRQRLPARTYPVLIGALKRKKLTAPPELWDMYPAANGK